MSSSLRPKTILWSGGSTGGSVMPLLSVAKSLWQSDKPGTWRYFFIGQKKGLEKDMVAELSSQGVPMQFLSLPAGKWRRYFSLKNFFDTFRIIAAFFLSFKILKETEADLVISAGGFVSVPLVWAAGLKKIPVLIHQQDARPGLANRLMSPVARVVTVTFEKSLYDYGAKAVWIGNPMPEREDGVQINKSDLVRDKYGLTADKPLIFVTGGALGAQAINDLILKARPKLRGLCQIIHQTGQGKLGREQSYYPDYQAIESLSHQDFLDLLSAADLVIARAGLGSLTELAAYRRSAILIPIPHSHQEDNAAVFASAGAAIVLDQGELTPELLASKVKSLLEDRTARAKLENNISKVMKRNALDNFKDIIAEILA